METCLVRGPVSSCGDAEMVFEKLADLVVRRYKMTLLVWSVVLLYIAPAITRANEVLVYQESEMVEGTTESLVAQQIIDEQFPSPVGNSPLMVVLTGQDVGSAEVRDFCLDLEDRATAVDSLSYLVDFTSVYSASRGMVSALASELGPAMFGTEYQVNLTTSLMYGNPALYLSNWMITNPSLSIPERDDIAYQTTMAALPYPLAGADAATAQA